MIERIDASFESSPSVAVIWELACGVGRIRLKMHDLRGLAFLATGHLSCFAELCSRRSIWQRPPSSDLSVESNFICAEICADRT